MKTILKKAKRTLSLLLVLLMVVPMTILLAVPSSSTEETVKYEVEGGCIYFDSSAGAIIDCDESVTNAVIPSMIEGVSVVTIGSHSFADCTSLTSISIPDSVTTIRDWWCVGCTSLTSIKVDKENKFFCDIDGVVFSKDQTTLISCPTGKKGIYIVPDTTTAIKEWAFTYCDSLTSVIIADSVTSVGDCAFRYCSSLSSITVGSGVTSISDNPFLDCDSLTSIKVDKDNKFLSDIDGVIFSKDQTTLICYPKSKKGIYTIPTCVTSIADAAFRECTSLTSVTIPDPVKSIGLMAFYFCESLTSVTLPDSVTSIGDWAFFGCGSLKSINIPNGVTRIERYTFGVCYSLTSIIIGDGVTSIDDNAFEQCSSLESVFYCGNNDSWNKIFIGTANKC